MKPEIYEHVNRLRLLVGYLGEKAQFNWWDTNFLSAAGLQFLAINFPRSVLAAGCNSVCEAARRLHDERIGKGGVYHLFRLPATVEESLHKALIDMDGERVRALLKNKDTAMEQLAKYTQNAVNAPAGPVQIGTTKNLISDFAISELAMHYLDAFHHGRMCFPYFAEK